MYEIGREYRLEPKRVKPFADQPRKRFHGIQKLAISIQVIGQTTPIEVIASDDPDYDAELVDGERRLKACLMADLPIRAIFTDAAGTEKDRYIRSVAANFCRQGHDSVEIMDAVLKLKAEGYSNEDIAKMFGKTITWVIQHASLKELAPEVLEALKSVGEEDKKAGHKLRGRGRMSLSLALVLITLPHEAQIEALRKIQEGHMTNTQARTYVQKQHGHLGIGGRSYNSPTNRIRSLRTAIENCSHVIDRYLDMRGAEYARMFRALPAKERNQLVKDAEELCSNLLMISDSLTKNENTCCQCKKHETNRCPQGLSTSGARQACLAFLPEE